MISRSPFGHLLWLIILCFGAYENQRASTPDAETTFVKDAELLRLAGFPVWALEKEPSLAAAFNLTPEQAEQLVSAKRATLDTILNDPTMDKKQLNQLSSIARKEFASLRLGVRSEEQITFIDVVKDSLRASSRQSTDSTTKQASVLEILEPVLSNEQKALIKAAGGKLP